MRIIFSDHFISMSFHVKILEEESKFPYVNNYGKIPELFQKILDAAEPTKLSHEILKRILGRDSKSDRPFISLLKRMKFLDESNTPTSYYKAYRDKTKSKAVMAQCIRDVYDDVYSTYESLHTLEKPELLEKFKIVTGMGKDSKVLNNIVSTFEVLTELADFSIELPSTSLVDDDDDEPSPPETEELPELAIPKKFGFSYTINLNLPATTDQRVYNSIFKSLRENLFK